MKIGILTQPLYGNYGGLLQAYALQRILKEMGHEVWIIDRVFPAVSLLKRIRSFVSYTLRRVLQINKYTWYYPTQKQRKYIFSNTNKFIDKYINPRTSPLQTNADLLRFIRQNHFNAYVIGSDQVWRPKYSPRITTYFCDFLPEESDAKRLAYAASFGVDVWEYSVEETEKCSILARRFDAISVREKSAILLCQEKLGVEVCHVVDPTLLLSKQDYIFLVEEEKETPNHGNLMTYILDTTNEKRSIVEKVASLKNMVPFSVMPKKQLQRENIRYLNDCVYPSVTKWIRGFMDAEYIIVDSFHGCVFSIIFNKPFLVIGNKERGMARFHSLLEIFGLSDRMIFSREELTEDRVQAAIDWDRVNSLKRKYVTYSLNFLIDNLK